MPKNMQEYLLDVRSKGGYSFTLAEMRKALDLSYAAARLTLHRYQKKSQIALVVNGFYVVIPPEYIHGKMLPVFLFIDDLMKWLEKPYYLALFTAAALHGAAHQQPMESFIMTVKPALRSIKNEKIRMNFAVKKSWDLLDVVQKKTDAGYVQVSSPELTALDLLSYLGESGINRCASVISELADAMTAEKLERTATGYPRTAVVQRLGYLLEAELGQAGLAQALQRALAGRKLFYTALSPHHGKKGVFVPKWKIIKNMEVETDL